MTRVMTRLPLLPGPVKYSAASWGCWRDSVLPRPLGVSGIFIFTALSKSEGGCFYTVLKLQSECPVIDGPVQRVSPSGGRAQLYAVFIRTFHATFTGCYGRTPLLSPLTHASSDGLLNQMQGRALRVDIQWTGKTCFHLFFGNEHSQSLVRG